MTSKYLKTALLCACLSTSLICAAGIAQKDMKTKNFTVYPTYDKNQKINGYSVSNDLELKVTDFTLISKLIAKAMQDGANDISGVHFTTEKADTVRSNLIKTAIYNGKQTAQAAAEATGLQRWKRPRPSNRERIP